jgi:hypothetical protein
VLALVAGCASSTSTTPVVPTTPAPVVAASPAVSAAPASPNAPAIANAAATTASLTPASTAAPTPKPIPSVAALKARVTFDGKNCVYSGPTVMPSPTRLTIEYAPTPAMEGSQVFTAAIRSDTTPADVAREDADPLSGVALEKTPEWVDAWTFMSQVGSGSTEFAFQVLRNPDGMTGVFDKVIVSCLTTNPGKPAPGSTILQLVQP